MASRNGFIQLSVLPNPAFRHGLSWVTTIQNPTPNLLRLGVLLRGVPSQPWPGRKWLASVEPVWVRKLLATGSSKAVDQRIRFGRLDSSSKCSRHRAAGIPSRQMDLATPREYREPKDRYPGKLCETESGGRVGSWSSLMLGGPFVFVLV